MPHDHFGHDHSGHGAHAGHDHARHPHAHVRPLPDVSGSLLRASAGARLGVAAAVVAVLWGGVFWAVS